MTPLTLLGLFGAFVALIYFVMKESFPGKLPPGPRGLPIIGSLLQISTRPHLRLGEWVRLYGPLFTLKLANYRFVVISDAKIAKEAFNNPHLSGRPDFPLFNVFSAGNHGIFSSSGSVWSEQRRFTLKTLRDMGFGKSTLQALALQEVQDYVQWLKSKEGESISLNRKFVIAALNSLWSITSSKRFESDDPHITKFSDTINEILSEVTKNPICMFYPNIARRFPRLTGWGALVKVVDEFADFTRDHVEEHKKHLGPKESAKDFVEAYLHEIESTKDPSSSFYKSEGEKNLYAILSDLFGAGSETTASTLTWAVLYLTKFKNIQDKIHDEIDKVVGRSRTPALEDRKSMPYMEAFILETLRKSTIAPFGIFHSATETTTLNGYTIPKDSWITANFHHIHHDPKVWGDPENVRPERFLSPDGKTVLKNENLIPFAVGKRICIGEQIAKDAVFMFLSGILHRFDIKLDPKYPEPSLDSITPFFLTASPYYVIMKDRLA